MIAGADAMGPKGPAANGGTAISERTIDNRPAIDRAILVGAPRGRMRRADAREHLEELARLADTAGAEVVGTVWQRIRSPHPHFYIGAGKAAELRATARASEADLVIFDDELKPDQARRLEDFLSIRVMDRAELILDIFATRARTREARMQVELAQLEYLLPRLKRMWSHLSRIRGGIGLRGPGETQLETDRRLIGTRIAELREKLEGVARSRATQRKGRANSFRAALVGYTNAGKSSLLKALSGADLLVEDRLFATLDSATRVVPVGEGHQALLTDTVGFIRKLPHDLIASFRSTLEEAREADLILHVVDASEPDWEGRLGVVHEVLEELDLLDAPRVLVFNKTDLVTHGEEEVLRARAGALEQTPSVFLSAYRPETLDRLRGVLLARIRASLHSVRVVLKLTDGETLAALYREGEVVETTRDDSALTVTARLSAPALGRLRSRRDVEVVRGAAEVATDDIVPSSG